jgi:hypothetical protein
MKRFLERARRKSPPPVVVVNVVLLAAVLALALTPSAGARQPTRARGAYTMVSGSIQGGNADVLYIIDSANQELIAVNWDTSRGSLNVIGYRNLAVDAKQRGER